MSTLTPKQDAFGQQLMAYHRRGGEAVAVVERSDGFIDPLHDLRQYFAGFADWAPRQRRAMRLARGRVLDVGCGAGRVALHLQQKGLDAVGIDISPLAVKVCRERGLKKARTMSLTQVSPRLGMFDTLIMFGNGFGLVENPRRARWLLRRWHSLTTDRARIIAESIDPHRARAPEDVRYQRENRRRGRMSGQMRLRVRCRTLATPWFDWLFASQDEMRDILAGTGWQVARVFETGGSLYCAVIEKEHQP